jgi:hypothetical protein
VRLSAERHTDHFIVQTAEVNFTCPHCHSLYEVVKVAEALPDSVDPQIACPICDGPPPAREEQFTFRYFLWRKADRGWERTPLGAQRAGSAAA